MINLYINLEMETTQDRTRQNKNQQLGFRSGFCFDLICLILFYSVFIDEIGH